MEPEKQRYDGTTQFIDLRDVIQVRIECSDKHKTSVPLSHFTTEETIAKFFLDHCHLTSSPAGMREDFQTLSKLLSRLCTMDLAQISEIVGRRKLKVEFEVRQTDR